jgi:hypothetical protein
VSLEAANAMLVRKTIVAEHVLEAVEKAWEAAGGVGFYRKIGLERFLREAHGAQGRIALGLDPITDAA